MSLAVNKAHVTTKDYSSETPRSNAVSSWHTLSI